MAAKLWRSKHQMYTEFFHQGKSLVEWREIFRYEYSLGELYRMAKGGEDFGKMASQGEESAEDGD